MLLMSILNYFQRSWYNFTYGANFSERRLKICSYRNYENSLKILETFVIA